MTSVDIHCKLKGIITITANGIKCYNFQYREKHFRVSFYEGTFVIDDVQRQTTAYNYTFYPWCIEDLQIASLQVEGPSIVQFHAQAASECRIELQQLSELQLYSDVETLFLHLDRAVFDGRYRDIKQLNVQNCNGVIKGVNAKL